MEFDILVNYSPRSSNKLFVSTAFSTEKLQCVYNVLNSLQRFLFNRSRDEMPVCTYY